MTQLKNRIITRGMGRSRGNTGLAGMVTQGYSWYNSVFQNIEEASRILVKHGRSAYGKTKREIENIVVFARLIRVNGNKPQENIAGRVSVGVKLNNGRVVFVEAIKRVVTSAIKIIIKKL